MHRNPFATFREFFERTPYVSFITTHNGISGVVSRFSSLLSSVQQGGRPLSNSSTFWGLNEAVEETFQFEISLILKT